MAIPTLLSLDHVSQAGDLAAPDGVTLAAGPPGTSMAREAEILARVLGEQLHLSVTLRVTSGSPQSLTDVDRRDADLALIRLSSVWSQRRAGIMPGRAVFAVAPWQRFAYLIIVPRGAPAGLATIQNAKRVGLGPPMTGAEGLMRPIFEAAGLKPAITTGNIADLMEQLGRAELDAVVIAQGRDGAWGLDSATLNTVMPLAPNDDDRETMIANLPHVNLLTVPAPLPFAPQPSRQLATWSMVVAHRDLAPEFVNRLTELLLRLPPALGDAPRQASDIQMDRLLPLHPGAARYYRDKGVRLDAIPVESN